MEMTSTTMNQHLTMYGVTDIDAWTASMTDSFTYKTAGAAMCIAGLLSDAQELLAMGQDDRARKTLNIAKHVLFEIADGKLVANMERA